MCVRAVVAKTMIEKYSDVQIFYINGRLGRWDKLILLEVTENSYLYFFGGCNMMNSCMIKNVKRANVIRFNKQRIDLESLLQQTVKVNFKFTIIYQIKKRVDKDCPEYLLLIFKISLRL